MLWHSYSLGLNTELVENWGLPLRASMGTTLSQGPFLQHPSILVGVGPSPASPAVRQHIGPEISISIHQLMDNTLKSTGQGWFR